MATFARSLSLPAGLRSVATRRLALALGSMATLAVALLVALTVLAAPAGAQLRNAEGAECKNAKTENCFGVQPRQGLFAAGKIKVGPLESHGGPVLHSSDAYVIYWDPIGNYRGDWERLIDRYFKDVGAESGHLGDVFALNGQYVDSQGRAANQSTFRGSYKDEAPYPTVENGGNCKEPAFYKVCLTDRQVQAELQRVISSGVLPGATGPPVYYLLTPPGVTVCTDTGSPTTCSNSKLLEKEVEENKEVESGICGYHSAINPGGASPIDYAVQPWVAGDAGFIETVEPLVTFTTTRDVLACQNSRTLQEPNQLTGLNPFGGYAEGLADVIISDLSVEQSNIVVNPLLTGWYQTSTSAEQGDMCQFNFGPPPTSPPTPNKETHAANLSNETINSDPYYVQWAFNSSDITAGKGFACWQGVSLEPFFTAPNPVNSGDVVGFNATESLVTLDAKTKGLPANEPYVAPIYSWDFGDGATISGTNTANEFHSYQYGGEYTVTLTVTDGGANIAKTTRAITVVGPPPPSSAPGSGAPGGAAATTPSSSSPSPGTHPPVPNPVATAAVASTSLVKTLRNGLVIRYSVNEQVAGRFEVLLASSIAKRIGLHGPTATGLAAGTPPQIVIAKAILVTTKGGRNTVKILFGKRTAARLRKLHKVTLMIRLIVRNASSQTPATTTVLSTVTLSH